MIYLATFGVEPEPSLKHPQKLSRCLAPCYGLRVLWGLLCRRSSKSIESLELVDLIRRLKGFLAANGAPQPGSQAGM